MTGRHQLALERTPQGDRVTRAWAGCTVVCIASGPSLNEAQIERVKEARAADRVRVIVINDNYLVAPYADVLYYADRKWAAWHRAGLERRWPWIEFDAADVREAWATFRGQRCTLIQPGDPAPIEQTTLRLRILRSDGLSTDAAGLATGYHSGHQALNLAVLAGASTVVLLGYDAARAGQRRHAFGDHPDRSEPPYREIRASASTAAAAAADLGVRIINSSPGSQYGCFETLDLETALAGVVPDPRATLLPA